jgi:hypothetical protein
MIYILSSRFTSFLLATISIGIVLFTIHTSLASGQVPSFVGNDISLKSLPEYPEQYSEVTITLDDYSVNTLGATIQWFVNGAEQKTLENERTIKITTRDLGTKEIVKVLLTRSGALPLSHSITITPSLVDIILESNTYIPTFYKGRALPSTESSVRAIALIHDGTEGSIKKEYTYKWSAGDTVLLGGPIKGKNVITYAVPLFGESELSVEIFDTKGNLVGGRGVAITPVEPRLYFYEYSSLRGLSERALTDPLTLIAEETTLYGVPYFMNTRMKTDEASFSWMIGGVPVSPDSSVPNSIVLKKDGAGESAVSLKIVTDDPIPQFVMQGLRLIF